MEQVDGKHPCPVCGRTIFREYDSYEICDFCGWEDNAYQEAHPYTGGGPNPSLYSYRKKYRQKIAADPDYTWAKECDEQREKRVFFGSSIVKIYRTMSLICFVFPSTPSVFLAF